MLLNLLNVPLNRLTYQDKPSLQVLLVWRHLARLAGFGPLARFFVPPIFRNLRNQPPSRVLQPSFPGRTISDFWGTAPYPEACENRTIRESLIDPCFHWWKDLIRAALQDYLLSPACLNRVVAKGVLLNLLPFNLRDTWGNETRLFRGSL